MGKHPPFVVGQSHGRFTLMCDIPPRWAGQTPRMWAFCACGGEQLVTLHRWKNSLVLHCGCVKNQKISEARTTHGLRNSSEYKIWLGMIQRCTNQKNKSYADYGGRGIFVCASWLSFENFYSAVGPRPGPQWSLDRIDNDDGYSPKNVRWATRTDQANNRRICRLYKAFGREQTLAQWAREFGLRRNTLARRLDYSILEHALVHPSGEWRRPLQDKRPGRRFLTYQGQTLSYVDWAKKLGLRPQNIWRRLKNGYTVAETLQAGHYREKWRKRGDKKALLPIPKKSGE